MARPAIGRRQWRALFAAVYEMNVARGHADFAAAVVASMSRLIPADLVHFHVLDRQSQQLLHRTIPADPFTPEEKAYYTAHADELPLVAYYQRTGDTRSRRLSELVGEQEWRASEFYRRCRARLGLVYCLALPVAVNATTVAGLVFDRRLSDFTDQHCALLDAFAPHLTLAWQRHGDPWNGVAGRSMEPQRLESFGLTRRETEVLLLMVEGHENRDIATILGRSLQTVQEHVGNIVRKLDQDHRHAATVFALRVMLGDVPPPHVGVA